MLISRTAFHKSATEDSFSAGVYGSIIATALVGALHEEHAASGKILASVLLTMAVFWLAHTWSEITGERIYHSVGFTWAHAREIAVSEWPLLEAALGPAIPLIVGWAGALSDSTAATIALVVCVAQCAVWGLLVGTRAYGRHWQAALSAVSTTGFALGLVALEILVLH